MKHRVLQHASHSRIAHLLIFFSPDIFVANQVATEFLTRRFGRSLPHPDVFVHKTSGKLGLHSIASVRTFLDNLFLSAHTSHQKAFLIESIDRMPPQTANALLKAFEEPPSNSLILGTTASLHSILPTILSRSQVIRIPAEQKKPSEMAILFAQKIRGASYEELRQLSLEIQKNIEHEINESITADQTILVPKYTELTSEAKQEILLENEAALAFATHWRAQQLLLDVYTILREHVSPFSLLPIFQEALSAIHAGLEVSQALMLLALRFS